MLNILETKQEITNAIPKLKKCEIEFKQVGFPDDETKATFFIVGWSVNKYKNKYRKFVSLEFDYQFKLVIETMLNEEK